MPIIAIQHSDTCRPGRLGVTLRDHGFNIDVVRVDKGESLPSDLDEVDGVFSLGGPQNATEKHAWISKEIDFLRAAHERNIPVVGVCLGAQLLADALGGSSGLAERQETGFIDVDILPPGHTDAILAGIAWRAPWFLRHGYEATELPPGAQLLASSERCKAQIYRVGMRTYAFQFHFEADRSMIDEIMRDEKTNLHEMGLTSEEFERHLDEKYEMFARLSDRLCLNIATYLIPKVATMIRV